MLQADQPDDYVLATGDTHTVREFVEEAFSYVGLDWNKYVEIDPRYFRPAEVELLIGDPSKAKEKLGWEAKTSYQELCHIMVDADMKAIGIDPVTKREADQHPKRKKGRNDGGEIAH